MVTDYQPASLFAQDDLETLFACCENRKHCCLDHRFAPGKVLEKQGERSMSKRSVESSLWLAWRVLALLVAGRREEAFWRRLGSGGGEIEGN